MDQMVSMLEKYADNLECIVQERTKQLAEEKQRTDTLLYQMLPRATVTASPLTPLDSSEAKKAMTKGKLVIEYWKDI